MERYIPFAVFGLVALSFPILMIVAARIVMLKKPNPVKYEAYECGNPVEKEAFQFRFSIRYLVIAILFVIFDVETVFLFPWAVRLKQLGLFGLIEMAIFLVILIVGYIYAYREGALEWA
jgi:NADH-quinone oxidoreductase subunit A